MKWYFDTSIIVAAALESHPKNAKALALFDRLVDEGHQGFLSVHSLSEVYAVLTRLPGSMRLPTQEVRDLIDHTVLQFLTAIPLDVADYRSILRLCADRQWSGGRVYDAIHCQCALKVDADQVYTLNLKDFLATASTQLTGKILAI